MWVWNYHSTLCKIPKERRSHTWLKPNIVCLILSSSMWHCAVMQLVNSVCRKDPLPQGARTQHDPLTRW